jgi:two-component system, NtrC family, response regulator AtoC
MDINKSLVFVVEDDIIFNKLLTVYLESKGIGTIKSFLSGEACLESAWECPAIILMDYDLPQKNGLEIMKEIKKISPSTEVVFLSGQSSVKKAIETIDEGASGYIIKDLDAKENAFYKITELQKILKERGGKSQDGDKNTSFYY